MGIKVIPSPFNPVPLVEADYVKPFGSTYVHPRRAFPTDNLEPQEMEAPFRQPILRDQQVCLQFRRGVVGTFAWNYTVLNFYDKEGNYINYIDPTEYKTLVGDVDSNGEQLYGAQFNFKPSDLAFLDDVQYFSMKMLVHFGDGSSIGVGDTVYTLTSDLLHLSDTHDGELWKYSNDYNSIDGTYFEFPEIIPQFMMVVPCGRMKVIPSGEYTVFNTQAEQIKKLYGQPYNKYSCEVYNITPRMMDTLNYAVQCDNLKIGDSEYVLEQDGAGESPEFEKPRQSNTYIFRDKNINRTLEFDQKLIPLFTRPATGYNYGLTRLFLYDGYNGISILPYVFEGSTNEDDWKSYLEDAIEAAGSSGEVIESGGTYYFRNGSGENFRVYIQPLVKPKELIVTVNVTNTAQPSTMAFYHVDTTYRLLVVKDSTGGGYAVNYNSDTNGITEIQRTFGTTGTKTIRVFHNDEEVNYQFNQPTGFSKITNVTGECSSILSELHMIGCDLSGHSLFDIGFLTPARYTLRQLEIRNSQLNGFVANWASSLVSGGVKPFFITYFELRGNTISQTNLDALINEFYTYCAWQPGYYIFASVNQTPAAVPSTSAANIVIMTNGTNLWTFITD